MNVRKLMRCDEKKVIKLVKGTEMRRKQQNLLEEMLIYWIKHWAFQYSYTQNSDTSFVKHKRIFVSSFSLSLLATWRWYIVISHGCHSANQDAAFRSHDCRITLLVLLHTLLSGLLSGI